MKILQVCSAESLGGGERHVIDLTRAMIDRGHQLHLAVREGSPLMDALAGYPIHWYELGLRNALDVISAQGIANAIRKNGIDILHAHLARDYTFCGVAARIAARLGNPVGFFITRHHFNPIKSNPLYAWTIGEARALIAVSDSVRESLIKSFPDYADRVITIPNWIDAGCCGSLSREEARARLGLTRRLAVGVIGQITRLKRQDLFIEAAARLVQDRHWSDAEFLIVGEAGPDDEAYLSQLRETANRWRVGDNLRFTGYVENLPALLAGFDIVVAPSDNEAFSLALVEAMASGCAVVATRVGGMAEIVKDGVSGLLIERDNAHSLVAALSRLLVDKRLREKIGGVARTSVIERFNRHSAIDQIERLYLNDNLDRE
ncbi:MAG TPA: glycosyltransferase family 4 protein [Blastocatellia bacterium]|jgi:glycosyltransferase involved in cell wall biosynthesis|nr:glycosyltransferase family 4 protein [Blastocatellia bacterium]